MKIDIDSLLDRINKKSVDTLTAYRDCLIVMLNCAPLRRTELFSIDPERAEDWFIKPDGSKHYSWRYKTAPNQNIIILIPDPLIPLAQKAIERLRELHSENILKKFRSVCRTIPEYRINFREFRKPYLDAELNNMNGIQCDTSHLFKYIRIREIS